jgi:hypothetical protein
MKLFITISLVLLIALSCQKNKCNLVTVTQNDTPCAIWGIKVGTMVYPADSIPDNFKHEGLVVCADYELYGDPRACICCGGTWAKIESIRNPGE